MKMSSLILSSLAIAASGASALAFNERAVLGAVQASPDCLAYSWRDRGKAPIGYINGMALTYARNYCQLRVRPDGPVRAMSAPIHSPRKDALAHYGVRAPTETARLRAAFTLAIGLGMRESTGNPTEGPDRNVDDPTPLTAEAGLFQTSYNSFDAHPQLRVLWNAYRKSAETCRTRVFREGSRNLRRPVVGGGAAAEYQRFLKECPAFAAEYAVVMLRYQHRHFGPLISRAAERRPACERMLQRVEAASGC